MSLQQSKHQTNQEQDRILRWNTCAILLCAFLFSITLTACGSTNSEDATPSSGTTFEIAPAFREFHAALGGEEVLGSAISQRFGFEEYECQYTVNALMCQNPVQSGDSRFILYPLGKDLEIQTVAGEDKQNKNSRVVNGITIYDEFVPFFDQLSGVRYAGTPITQVKINNPQQRIEQYFENVGFYRMFDDPPGTVKLLAYGSYACEELCNYSPLTEAMLVDPVETIFDQPFQARLKEMSSGKVFGEPLTQPYTAEDGALEQVYTNAVLYSPPGKPNKVFLRPIAEHLGMPVDEPGPQRHKNDKSIVFYPVDNGLGFHLPAAVDEFITNHGGRKLSGDPISESSEVEPGIFRQCFTNYCTLYQPSTTQGKQVTLVALGQRYLEVMQSSNAPIDPAVISSGMVTMILIEEFQQLPEGKNQRIDIQLVKKEDQSPLVGIESTLDILLPDGTHYTSDIDATQEDGTTSVVVPEMKSIPIGSLLTYRVCLKTGSPSPVCAEGSYLVWNAP